MKNLVLLITTQRCGSTWLLDLIRCHPRVGMLKKASVFAKLGLNGFRYPQGMTNRENGLELELYSHLGMAKAARRPYWNKNLWRHVLRRPAVVKIPDPGEPLSAPDRFDIGIEKLHPEFYRFDSSKLIRRINRLKTRYDKVHILLVSRSPLAAIGSHFSYRKRNPAWYAQYSDHQVLELYKKSHRSLLEIQSGCACKYLDYAGIQSSARTTLQEVYRWLMPSESEETASEIADFAIESTSRERRPTTTFLSQKPGDENEYKTLYADTYRQFKTDINAISASYQDLLRNAEIHGDRIA